MCQIIYDLRYVAAFVGVKAFQHVRYTQSCMVGLLYNTIRVCRKTVYHKLDCAFYCGGVCGYRPNKTECICLYSFFQNRKVISIPVGVLIIDSDLKVRKIRPVVVSIHPESHTVHILVSLYA